MPIRDFQFFKTLKNTFAIKPLRLLANEKLIIDGAWFIRKHSVSIANLEPFITLLDWLSDTEMIWIWNGIKPKRAFYTDFANSTVVEIKKKNFINANKNYAKFIECYDIRIKDYINTELKRRGIIYMTAPYLAMAQAIYIQRQISCYYFGPTDYLLFEGSEKLITEIYFKTKQIEIFYKIEVFRALKLNAYKFQELTLLLGSEFCPTIPSLRVNFSSSKVIEMFYGSPIVETIKNCQDVPEEYIQCYINALNYLRYCPVFTENGLHYLRRYSNDYVSATNVNLSEVFGRRLRDDFYEKIFIGEINTDTLEMFVYDKNRENDEYVDICCYLLKGKYTIKDNLGKENKLLIDFDNLSIKNMTLEQFVKEKCKLDVVFIDDFPLYYQIIIFKFLNDKTTQNIIDKIILLWLDEKSDITTSNAEILSHFLRFTKQIKFCSEFIEILETILSLKSHKNEYFETKNFIPCLKKFLKANNSNNKYNTHLAKFKTKV